MNRYHCCATCKHIKISKDGAGRATVVCTRLGFETKTKYQFDCWDPRQTFLDKMIEEDQRTSGVLSKRSSTL